MGIRTNGKITFFGNFERPRRYKHGRPRNWHDRDYKAIVPYTLKWRPTLGKVECDCKEVVEAYQPYLGFTLYHMDDCAIMRHYRKYPQMENFMWDRDVRVIAQSE